ncbi:DUF1566 domain-containing protein [Vibrio cholerae]|nr:DUF1566 domain-containing protein [Vibrio cholerae]
MKKYIATLSFIALLSGCNGENSGLPTQSPNPNPNPNPEVAPQGPREADIYELTIKPQLEGSAKLVSSSVMVLKGGRQQFVASAKYHDGHEGDVTTSSDWEIVGDPTVARVSSSGLLTGIEGGTIELIATKDGITSNVLDITVCGDLAGPCIDVFDTGNGKLFTSSPSVAYLDSIGGIATDGTLTEIGDYGPAGDFYLFNWDNANALCAAYNTHSIGGRTNWRLASLDELKMELHDVYGDMFSARGWPTLWSYWSTKAIGPYYEAHHLFYGVSSTYEVWRTWYVSCVSDL